MKCFTCGKEGLWSIFKINKDGSTTGKYFCCVDPCVYGDMDS